MHKGTNGVLTAGKYCVPALRHIQSKSWEYRSLEVKLVWTRSITGSIVPMTGQLYWMAQVYGVPKSDWVYSFHFDN